MLSLHFFSDRVYDNDLQIQCRIIELVALILRQTDITQKDEISTFHFVCYNKSL